MITTNFVSQSSITTQTLLAPNIVGSNLQFSTLQIQGDTSFFEIPSARMGSILASTITIGNGNLSNINSDRLTVSTILFSTLTASYPVSSFITISDILSSNVSAIAMYASSFTATAFIAPIGEIDTLYGSNIVFSSLQSYLSTGFFSLPDYQANNISAATLAGGIVRTTFLTGVDTIQATSVSTANIATSNISFSSLQAFVSAGFLEFQDSRFSEIYASSIIIQTGIVSNASADTLIVSTVVFSSLTTTVSISSFLQTSDLLTSNISTNNVYVGNVITNQVNTTNIVAQTATFIGNLNAPGVNVSSITTQYYSTSSFNLLSGDFLVSSLLSTGSIFAGNLQSVSISTNSIVGSNVIFSTIQFPNTTFLDFTDMRIRALSTQQILTSSFNTNNYTANNFLIGNSSNAGYLGFFGTAGNYNNSVLAEVSTGATSQDFVIFRGSSVNDQIRLQTTGSIRFEAGVAATLYPNVSQINTPTLIIQSSSNIGILTENPQASLDVAGSFRSQTISSQQVQTSSLQIGPQLFATDYWYGSTNYVSANTVRADIFTGNFFIGGSFAGDGSLLSNINVSTGLAIPVSYGSTLTMSTGILRSGGLFLGTAIV